MMVVQALGSACKEERKSVMREFDKNNALKVEKPKCLQQDSLSEKVLPSDLTLKQTAEEGFVIIFCRIKHLPAVYKMAEAEEHKDGYLSDHTLMQEGVSFL